MKLLKLSIAVLSTAALSACSHESWTKVEETTRVSSLFNSVLFPVNLVAKAGQAFSTPGIASLPDSEGGKRIVYSKQITAASSTDEGAIARAFTTIRVRFIQRDYGDVLPDQAQANAMLKPGDKGAVGRYQLGEKSIIVRDAGDAYKVRYEDEVE